MRTRFLGLPVLIAVGVCLVGTLGPGKGSVAAQSGAQSWEVPFLTLRDRTGSDDPAEIYGDERGTLNAGWCEVGPRDLGGIEQLAQSVPSYLREEFMQVRKVRHTTPMALLNALLDLAFETPLLVYVHGYNIGFEKKKFAIRW